MAILAIAAVVAWINRPRDESTRTSVDDAIASFRQEEASGQGDLEGPLAGVYRYATVGAESADSVLADATHDYRGISTIVIDPTACGTLERWQVLEQRWTETEICPSPHGDRLAAVREYHEFFGVKQEDAFRCGGDPIAIPAQARPRYRSTSRCGSDDSTVVTQSRLVGFGRIAVGTKTFPTIHTIADSRIEGDSPGISRREDWRRRSDGLLLRRSAQSTIDSDLGGGTDYTEYYTLRLLDTVPRR